MSGTMLLLGLAGLMDSFNAAVPSSIVRGIQLAVGLSLAKKVCSWDFVLCVCCGNLRFVCKRELCTR